MLEDVGRPLSNEAQLQGISLHNCILLDYTIFEVISDKLYISIKLMYFPSIVIFPINGRGTAGLMQTHTKMVVPINMI